MFHITGNREAIEAHQRSEKGKGEKKRNKEKNKPKIKKEKKRREAQGGRGMPREWWANFRKWVG